MRGVQGALTVGGHCPRLDFERDASIRIAEIVECTSSTSNTISVSEA